MEPLRLEEMTWPEVAALDRRRLVVILPTGATEAHGPHLPLNTDNVIAEAMAEGGGRELAAAGWQPVLLPTLAYTAAGFARGFAGTLSMRPETVTALLVDLASRVLELSPRAFVVANAHFDPEHLGSIYTAARQLEEAFARAGCRWVFPDATRKPWGSRLTDEFKSGACHAGRYEGSMVLARRPELVRQELAQELPDNPASLSVAIRDGKASFEEAGGPQAYFGAPAAATPQEGRETIAVLGGILAEAVSEALGAAPSARLEAGDEAGSGT